MASADPGDVVDELRVPGGATAGASLGERGELGNGEVGQSVEKNVALDVFQVQAVGERAAVEGEAGSGWRIRNAAAKFVQQVGTDGPRIADDCLAMIVVAGVRGQQQVVGSGGRVVLRGIPPENGVLRIELVIHAHVPLI